MAEEEAHSSRTGPRETPRDARELLSMARAFLERKGVPHARLEAEILAGHALGLDRLGLFMQLDRPLSAAEVDRARDLLVRRGRREPVAYITGAREFYGRRFQVDPSVLIPRPETELLVDRARELLRGREAPRVADVGTGSGCIATTIALEVPSSEVHGIELSDAALDCARRNAAALGAEVRWHLGEGFAVLAGLAAGERPFDLVLCNPPYVRPEERSDLAPEVREHEPGIALFTPEGDPDHWVRGLCDLAPVALAEGGALLVELAAGQADRAIELARERGLVARAHADLAGIDRILEVARA